MSRPAILLRNTSKILFIVEGYQPVRKTPKEDQGFVLEVFIKIGVCQQIVTKTGVCQQIVTKIDVSQFKTHKSFQTNKTNSTVPATTRTTEMLDFSKDDGKMNSERNEPKANLEGDNDDENMTQSGTKLKVETWLY